MINFFYFFIVFLSFIIFVYLLFFIFVIIPDICFFFHLGKGRVVNLNPSPSPKKKNNMSVRICLLLQNVSEMFPPSQ